MLIATEPKTRILQIAVDPRIDDIADIRADFETAIATSVFWEQIQTLPATATPPGIAVSYRIRKQQGHFVGFDDISALLNEAVSRYDVTACGHRIFNPRSLWDVGYSFTLAPIPIGDFALV